MLRYEFCQQSDCGRVRDNNEDSVTFDAPAQLAVLADGMGGYLAGEVASGMATGLIQAELRRVLPELQGDGRTRSAQVQRAIEQAVQNANLTIWSSANTHLDCMGMGTTVVTGVFLDDSVVLAHVGDSRCYRLRGDELACITRDHSVLQMQIDAGLVTPEEALTATNRNLVTRALGVEAMVEVEVQAHAAMAGDLYLLCSDGLTDMLGDLAIANILFTPGDLAQKAAHLVDAANACGGRDNVSVVLVAASERASATAPGVA